MERPLRFGIFMAPFHPVGQNPTLALERDLELIVRLDELGYDEAWIGEHHSAGLEIIASPEVFIKEVFPRFQGSADLTVHSREWCRKDHESLIGGAMNAVVKEIDRYEKETGYRIAVANLAQGQGQHDS
jgi:hypothetical protein